MSIKLYPPGKRSKYWHARGVYHGKNIDQSTFAELKKDAEAARERIEETIRTANSREDIKTFRDAADAYIQWRKPKKYVVQWIDGICALIGDRAIDTITQKDLANLMVAIFHNKIASNSTKNRSVLVPLSAIVHYAAKCGWCAPQPFYKLKEDEPKPRYVTDEVEKKLVKATKDDLQKHTLIIWLFRQGDRISDILNVTFVQCDFDLAVVRMRISKTGKEAAKPLDDDLVLLLKELQKTRKEEHRKGKIFTWGDRHNVYRWLRPLCRSLQVEFTPHMARHTLGKRFSDSGASLRVTMDMLTHKDVRSSMRYQAGDVETVRKFSQKVKSGGLHG